jgi:hypothetical protein
MWIQLRKEHNGCYIHIAADFEKTPEFNVLTFNLSIDYEKAYNLKKNVMICPEYCDIYACC